MIEDSTPMKRSPAARRMSLSRARRKDGLRVVPFEVRDTEIDTLINHNLLEPVDRGNKVAVARALGKLLDRIPAACWRIAMQSRGGM